MSSVTLYLSPRQYSSIHGSKSKSEGPRSSSPVKSIGVGRLLGPASSVKSIGEGCLLGVGRLLGPASSVKSIRVGSVLGPASSLSLSLATEGGSYLVEPVL